MESNYKAHPFVQALEAVAPLVVPSFNIVSIRDNFNPKQQGLPMLGYVIVNSINESYNQSTQRFEGRLQLAIDLLVHEPNNSAALFWCEYNELKANTNRQAFMYDMENKIRQIILLALDPTKATQGNIKLNRSDVAWSEYNFKDVQVSRMQQISKMPPNNTTGASCLFSISYSTPRISCCITNVGSMSELEQLKQSFTGNSISDKLIDLQIKKINTDLPLENMIMRANAIKGVNGGNVQDGDDIISIEDQSGNGYTLTPPIGGNAVKYVASGINGLPCIRTVDSYLQNLTFSIPSDPSVSIFIVLEKEAPQTNAYGAAFMLAASYNVAGGNFLQLNGGLSSNYAGNFSSNSLDQQLSPYDNNPVIISIIKDAIGVTFYINGVSYGTKAGSQSIDNVGLFLGSWNGFSNNGLLADFVVYSEKVSNEKRDIIHQSLSDIWNIV